MEFKSGCVVVALILIFAMFSSGCINQDSQRLDTLEKDQALDGVVTFKNVGDNGQKRNRNPIGSGNIKQLKPAHVAN